MDKNTDFMASKEVAARIALSMYEGEPCRICGETITDATKAVYAGYSADNKSRSAHELCWKKNVPVSAWVYPDAV